MLLGNIWSVNLFFCLIFRTVLSPFWGKRNQIDAFSKRCWFSTQRKGWSGLAPPTSHFSIRKLKSKMSPASRHRWHHCSHHFCHHSYHRCHNCHHRCHHFIVSMSPLWNSFQQLFWVVVSTFEVMGQSIYPILPLLRLISQFKGPQNFEDEDCRMKIVSPSDFL